MNPVEQPPNAGPTLRPVRFSVRSLLLGTAGVAAFLTLCRALGWGTGLGILFVALVVFAHVAGNAIGSHLQKNTGRRRSRPAAGSPFDVAVDERQASSSAEARDGPAEGPLRFAAPTELGERRPLHRSIRVATASGAILGAVVGGPLLALLHWEQATVPSILFGTSCSAILGGFWGFWTHSLWQVVSSAWKQAHREP